jgi:hypothetical protein
MHVRRTVPFPQRQQHQPPWPSLAPAQGGPLRKHCFQKRSIFSRKETAIKRGLAPSRTNDRFAGTGGRVGEPLAG